MYRYLSNKKEHPDFRENTRDNDIAIVRVEVPFQFGDRRPVGKVPRYEDKRKGGMPKTGDVCKIAGWGQTKPMATKGDFLRDQVLSLVKLHSPLLKEANVSIWEHSLCKERLLHKNLPKDIQEFIGM